MDQRWIALLLAIVAFSGCAESEDPETCEGDACEAGEGQSGETGTGGETGGTGGATGSGSGGSTEGNSTNETVPNTPPTVQLSLVTPTAVAGQQAEFSVVVGDDDGDALMWSFDADGDGEEDLSGNMSGSAIFTYDADGAYTATVNVTDGTAFNETSIEILVEAPAPTTDPNAPEDRGWYIFHPATKLCYVKNYVDVGGLGLIYNAPLSGGDWYITEDNGIAGLQIEDNHPMPEPAKSIGGFSLTIPDCKGGDLTTV